MINAQSAESKGIELELNTRLTDDLKLNVGYTYTNAELTEDFIIPDGAFGAAEGEALPGVPESTFISSLHYRKEFADVVMSAQLGVSYKAEFTTGFLEPSIFYEVGYDEIPASTLWNASVKFDVDSWTFTVFAENLFNADDATASDGDGKYIIDAAAGEVKAGEQYSTTQLGDQLYRVRPRTIGASISYKF
jgi:outer membrane receptor protein involved in Fe transport